MQAIPVSVNWREIQAHFTRETHTILATMREYAITCGSSAPERIALSRFVTSSGVHTLGRKKRDEQPKLSDDRSYSGCCPIDGN